MKIIIRGNYDKSKQAALISHDGRTITSGQLTAAIRSAGLITGDYPRVAHRAAGDTSDGILVYRGQDIVGIIS